MDLGCFHKYIAFYAYINCCKTNSSLKRGNEKVAISNINTIISNDIQKVWNIVLAVDKYNSWRSDLSKTEIINDKQFIEYTKNGYATTFTVTVAEPYKRWEFDMENSNMKGHWIGVFIDKGNETQIDFTENVIPKKWFMKPFVKTYLKKQQKQFVMDLNSVYTRSGQNSTPNSNATNLHSSQKRCCSFCISSSNASPTFQVQKSIFHQMTKPIQVTVILPLLLAISFSRNDDIHSSISGISNDLIGVIPTIGQ